MPATSPKIFEQIGAGEDIRHWESAAKFGLLPKNVTVKRGEVLFPRIDLEKELEALEALKTATKAEARPEEAKSEKQGLTTLVDITDFAKISLRVAKVILCERVPKSDKLLRLELDDGEGGRQVVSGISQWYPPDALIGKKLVLVANLKPAKLRGVESQGMLLAADVGESGEARVIFVDDDLPCGAKIR